MPIAMPPAISVLDCRPSEIRLATGGNPGDFSGMSRSGTLIVLRNVAHRACRVPALPKVGFLSAGGRAIPAARNVPVGMHPGPVILPVVIAPGAVVSTPLRWVSGEVFDRSRCYQARTITVTIGGTVLRVGGGGKICALAGKPAGFDQPVLRPGTATSS